MNYILKSNMMHGGMAPSCQASHRRIGGASGHSYHTHHSRVRSRSLKNQSILSPCHSAQDRYFHRQSSLSTNRVSKSSYSMSKLEELNLCMQVMDYDRFSRDDPIGEILLPLKGVKLDSSPIYFKNLQKPTAKDALGEILISLLYSPQKGKLTIVIIKAKDLPAKDITGTSDPYVKLWLIEQGTKVEKRKTSVRPHNLQPTFNESFTFTVTPEKMAEATQIAITVMDHDMLSSNDEMGHIILGCRGTESGQKHWKEMTSRPNAPVMKWHALSPKW